VPEVVAAAGRSKRARSNCASGVQNCTCIARRLPAHRVNAVVGQIASPLTARERHFQTRAARRGPEVVVRAVSNAVSMLGAARCRAWPLAVAAALWLHADPAVCARITAVRVGAHPGYTRVVLETDAPADFEVVTAPAATPGEVTLWIAAESRARDVAPTGPDAPAVSLEPQPDGSTLARIRPPRLVLDLRPATREAVAEAPAPPPPAPETPPLPPPAAAELPTPTPTEVAVTPPAVESAPVAAPAEIEAPPPVASPPPQAEPTTPPVAVAPTVDHHIDPRSLVVGLAAGIGLALVAFASRRRREEAVSERSTGASAAPEAALAAVQIDAIETAPSPGPDASHEAEAEPEPGPDALHATLDVLRMHQRLDARLAEIADRLADLAQRQSRLEARSGAETAELASQRAAIARLQRSLRPAAPIRAPRQVP
jgi:hypothetical protein